MPGRSFISRLSWLKPPYRTAVNTWAAAYSWWHRVRAKEIRKVQVGCGKDIRPGWWNTDAVYFKGVDEICDITRPWKIGNVEYIYGEHFIEHLTLHQGIEFLKHAGHALKQGGVIRLSTPNLTSVVRFNLPHPPSSLDERLHQTVVMNCCFHGYGHQFLYSQEFLIALLQGLGFEDVRYYDFGQSDIPELRGLEKHGPFEIREGIPNIITVEGTRGRTPIAIQPALRAILDRHFNGDVYK